MFAAETKAIVKSLGAENFIPNKDLNKTLDLLTVVRIKQGMLWTAPKYKVLESTLPELMGVEEFSPGEQFEAILNTEIRT